MADLCCTCGGGKGFMYDDEPSSDYYDMWVCAGCAKPRRLYFERMLAEQELQFGNKTAE